MEKDKENQLFILCAPACYTAYFLCETNSVTVVAGFCHDNEISIQS